MRFGGDRPAEADTGLSYAVAQGIIVPENAIRQCIDKTARAYLNCRDLYGPLNADKADGAPEHHRTCAEGLSDAPSATDVGARSSRHARLWQQHQTHRRGG